MKNIGFDDIEFKLVTLFIFGMGLLIVWFNVMGYEILFPNRDYPINPFTVLLFITESAVLIWTSSVIKNWYSTSRILKVALFVLVPAFWLLCYTGINSYLNSLATNDVKIVLTAEHDNETRQNQIEDISRDIKDFNTELIALRARNVNIDHKIESDTKELSAISIQDSERRKTARDCSQSPDCAAAIANFKKQIDSLNRNIETSQKDKEANSDNIRKLESDIFNSRSTMNSLRSEIAKVNNTHSGTKTDYDQKKQMYVSIVNKVSSWFGVKFDDPFGAFISFISALIYPVYFILNLLKSLSTPEHKERRKHSLLLKRERRDIRDIALAKLLKYMRVWASRRTKIIEVEKIVEVPVEVEKEVERTIEVEKIVEVEIEKEVERIVEVEKIVEVEIEKFVEVPVKVEVPVYVDRIQKVSEPMIVKEPQIIIHERIVPIPENITSDELEELLNAQSRSEQTTRVESPELA
ncbi:hypothetical protein VHA01S_016_00460 [Vibrio halioticoli NBRC 102217]|uniref:DUF4407 domain-containing protein n=1 Tax=Vibrio halioticoli NBRC 102217 TaxID=1219072 RepID=V5F240_9VIBR|nr:hypothetical protein [Vibrio halioticoli]GAD89189.1 hypothetical protein VHA01S_016_00460 [Vibrio halioticoli NBRC 102217]